MLNLEGETTRSAERTSSQLSTGSSGSASSFPSTAAPEAKSSDIQKEEKKIIINK
jgi:hypothetical protein